MPVVKRADGKPSIMDDTVTELGTTRIQVGVTKDGRIFDSEELPLLRRRCIFHDGDLTTLGTDGKRDVAEGANRRCWTPCKMERDLLASRGDRTRFIRHGHALTSRIATSHTESADPYLKMLGANSLFTDENRGCRMQPDRERPKFPGLERNVAGELQ